MSPWVVGKPVPYITEKAPLCIYLKVTMPALALRELRECTHPKFLEKINERYGEINAPSEAIGRTPKCLFIDERLRVCAWYDCGDPDDKRALKNREKPKSVEKAKSE